MKHSLTMLLLGLALASGARAQSEGIFADFVTSHGNFTVWLDMDRAPRAVASFVGLATGEGGWVDLQTNVWHRPFYDGSLIHRIVKDVVADPPPTVTNDIAIQGGGLPLEEPSLREQIHSVYTNTYSGSVVSSNAPGITTNLLNLPVVITNPPAVATNYVWKGETVTTVAPRVVRGQITASVVSSNESSGDWVTSRAPVDFGYTNATAATIVTTGIVQVAVLVTNGGSNALATTHTAHVTNQAAERLQVPIVLTNFVNAGYTMLDNVTNGLLHSNGVIAMANSGPNTDCSQFFITVTNAPYWDGGYSVFGHVTDGMATVRAIAAEPVQAGGSRPIADIVVSNVTIRRVGAAAEAFDISVHGVPSPESVPMDIAMQGVNVQLRMELASQTKPLLFSDSTSMAPFAAWDHQETFTNLVFYTNATQTLTMLLPVAELGPRHFFHAARIRYPIPLSTPETHWRRTFTFRSEQLDLTYSATFPTNVMQQGTGWSKQGTNDPVARTIFAGSFWTRDAYMARLNFIDNSGQEYNYTLGFTPGAVTNRFTGTYGLFISPVRYNISGTFTMD